MMMAEAAAVAPPIWGTPSLPHVETNDDDGSAVGNIPGPETYMPHASKLGLVPIDSTSVVRADSFDDVRTKARHLAILCGFQVRMAKGSSNRRRVWVCSSVEGCPFAVIAQQNRGGIHIKTRLEHNHPFHLPHQLAKRYTTATTHELACYVRQSDAYRQAADVSKITARQISDAVFAHTGRHVKANRASVIKKLLVGHPETLVPCSALFSDAVVQPPSPPPPPPPSHPPAALPPPPPIKSMAEAVWDCFVYIANAPSTVDMLGIQRVRHMVAVFKADRDTLRALLLLTCPRPNMLPCVATNPPNIAQFVQHYLRQADLGFF
ncbi:Aste57867_16059 [Aphanomyces stellatus]|uniref:Aste57867_16059 protein n=1 Tax=Aphanomyces stellatus TaxID=120398 RepID=A0A485L6G6_9STRA|nr:hypothetical protein As57867_016003 [Aphanomyces stellatus]VFT92843.1 Aste57867_16059 [Aphanomyces stellatus]